MPDHSTENMQGQPARAPVWEDGEISLLDIARFFRRQWYVMVIPAILVGVAYSFWDARQKTPMYEAKATLLIVPPKVSSEIRPAMMSVQGYQRLFSSDEIVEKTRSWLVKGREDVLASIREQASRTSEISKVVPAKGTFAGQEGLNISGMLRSEVVPGEQGDRFAPMLEAVCTASDPELAAAVVNVWALVFKSHTRDLLLGTFSDAVKYVEEAHPKVKKSLEEQENRRGQWITDQEREYGKLVQAWTQKIAAFRAKARSALSARRLADLLRELKHERTLCAERLKQTPAFHVSRRGAPDEALLRAIEKGDPADWETFRARSVIEQQPNPAHVEVRNELIRLDAELANWAAYEKDRGDEAVPLPAVSAAMTRFEVEDAGGVFEPSAFQNRPQSDERLGMPGEAPQTIVKVVGAEPAKEKHEFDLINDGMRTEWDGLVALREAELARVRREALQNLGKYERELAVLRENEKKLSSLHSQIELSKAQQDIEDVRIGSYAVAPRTPMPQPAGRKYLVAAVLAGMLGFVIALLREAK